MEMTLSTIPDIFPGFEARGEVQEAALSLRVSRVALNRGRNILRVYAESSILIPKRVLLRLERELDRRFFPDAPVCVKIVEKFRIADSYTPESFFSEYRPSILEELKGTDVLLFHMLSGAKVSFPEQDVMEVSLKESPITGDREDVLWEILSRIFRERCGFRNSIRITHYCDKEHKALETGDQLLVSKARQIAGASAAAVKEAESVKNPPKAGARKTEQPPDVLYGRDFEGDSIPIESIDGPIGDVIIRGVIIESDSRETKSGKCLMILTVTDNTDTIRVKVFVPANEADEKKAALGNGTVVKIRGKALEDDFDHELSLTSVYGIKQIADFRQERIDYSPVKRTELHCHTKMSDMDGVTDAAALVRRAYRWGHSAIAITDHGVVQAFPEANHEIEEIDKQYRKQYAEEHPEASKDELKKISAPFKVIYGMEAYLVDDLKGIVTGTGSGTLEDSFVVFDIETTGFSPVSCRIIEIGAVKVSGGRITDRFSSFVDPGMPVPFRIEKLTGISTGMVSAADTIDKVLPRFLDFSAGCTLVAHNASFDMSFITENCMRMGLDTEFTYLDTLALARLLLPNLTRYRLDNVAKAVGVSLEHHHRAVDDAECTALIFLKFVKMLREQEIITFDDLRGERCITEDAVRKLPSYHAVILAMNETGRVNLYRLVSESHLKYFNRRPKLPKSFFLKHREGLLIGSACEAGELFQALLRGASESELKQIVDFYDYLEIQPVGNNAFMIRDEKAESVNSEEDLRDLNRQITALGEKYDKPVAATCDVHFMDPEDEIYRRIIMHGKGFPDADEQAPLYLHTTEEMLEEFAYLGAEKAEEVVITNPARIADRCERISPIREGKFPPVIENSDQMLRDICYAKAHEVYGPDLPEIVSARLERELTSIISNGYAVMYIIAQKLVWKSNEDGYLVGSRGSVGSSFVATMAGITEVNPLSPHYLCGDCHYVDFDSEEVKAYSGKAGCDMPDKNCPRCGKPLKKMGFDIPFETFLGFTGNKEPDIDLNFSGEYQSKAHKYTEVIFGAGQTFRAGTIGTLADKTAFGYVKNYFEEKGISKRNCEVDRIVSGCTGIRRTTGQHPGGIIVLPIGEDINSFTPVQHPANDNTTDIVTTHFDYHSIDANLLKLDILGHDDPTMIRMLEDLTGLDATAVPLDEPKVMSLFKGTEALGITPADIGGCPLGCLGVPEFGTDFAMQMLLATKPQSFSDLVRIAGLAHGTDVWLGNAQTLIEEGKATISTAICTRDDIMTYLIHMGLDSELSFTIMENVRKGKGLKDNWIREMEAHGVPDWYIWSCQKIKYMFPKAHAAAYVMMAYRIAWFKVYQPLAYYAAFFSIRASAFSYEMMCMGRERLEYYLNDYYQRIDTLTNNEKDTLRDMRIVQEMYARGFDFVPIDLYSAKAHRFRIVDGKLMPSIDAIRGLGDKAAEAVELAARDGEFLSKDDFRNRTKVSKTVIDTMSELGLFGDLPESNQMSLFDLM